MTSVLINNKNTRKSVVSVCFFLNLQSCLLCSQQWEKTSTETCRKMDFFLLFCFFLFSVEHRLSECIPLTAGLTWRLWDDGSTLPKTSGKQRGCGNNRSEIDRAGASVTFFHPSAEPFSHFNSPTQSCRVPRPLTA